ncbi:MAG TPA: S41 family peptidase [Vicinamibacterales bacterium]|jgi:carboxyl-terminal processing protease|nr:S41 family peptidase [Vicinamibacterales bacterium]
MTARTRLWVLVVSTPVIAFTLIGGYLGQAMTRDETLRSLRVFEDVMQLVVENYVEDVDVQKAMRGAMRGLTDGLDVDSAFLNPALVKAFESKETPAAGEVGIDLARGYYLRVVSVRDGSPAAKAGIRTGDYLRAIDGRSTRDISAFEGNRLLRGGAGSKVTLLVIRGSVSDPHELTVNRERLGGAEVTSRMAGAGTGYLRVVEFTQNSPARIKQAVDALAKTGAVRYVIDLRSTSRGDLDSGVESARLFVRGATLAVRVSRDPLARPEAKDKTKKDSIAAQANDGAVAAPVVLLVDSGTSGAAELFAAALDGNNRAELVGERTIGRVARQQLVKLPDGSGLLLTNVRYLSPSSAAIHEKGLTPDVHVPEPDVDFGADPPAVDATLDKALERLTAQQKKAA